MRWNRWRKRTRMLQGNTFKTMTPETTLLLIFASLWAGWISVRILHYWVGNYIISCRFFPLYPCLLSHTFFPGQLAFCKKAVVVLAARRIFWIVQWSGVMLGKLKVYFPKHVLFIINTVIRGAHDNVRTCVIS